MIPFFEFSCALLPNSIYLRWKSITCMRLLCFVFCILYLPVFGQSSKRISAIISRNEQFLEVNPKAAIDSLHYALDVARKEGLWENERDILNKLATIDLIRFHNFAGAMEYMNQLKALAETRNDKQLHLFYENKLGELYYYNEDTRKKAFPQFEKALQESLKSKSLYLRDHILCNYGIVQSERPEFRQAISSYQEALRISKKNQDDVIRSAIYSNLGVTYLYLQKPDSAKWYFEQALKVAQLTPEQTDDAERNLYLGLFSLDNQDPVKALAYFGEAEQRKKWFLTHNERALLYKGISRAYAEQKDFEQAYENRLLELAYRDSSRQADMAVQAYGYDYKLQLRKVEAERKQTVLWLIVASLSSVLTLVVIYFLVKRYSFQRKLLVSQGETERLEKERIRFEKEVQDREMATKSMHLLEKDNLVSNVLQELNQALADLSEKDREKFRDVISELKSNQNTKRWDEFEWSFEKVHPHFFAALEQDFPNLSPNERKLCAFLSLNMSTKDIGILTGQTTHAITIARARLRKKLGLTHSETDLIQFLRKYNQAPEK